MPGFILTVLSFLIFTSTMILTQSISGMLISGQAKIFENFKNKYSKTYISNSEELYRNLILFQNAHKIVSHNLKSGKKYKMAMNPFSDMTELEFRLKYAVFRPSDKHSKEMAIKLERKYELEQETCQCKPDFESYKTELKETQISIGKIKQEINSIRSTIVEENKKKKEKLGGVINNFTSFIPFLSIEEYQVTVNKMNSDGYLGSKNSDTFYYSSINEAVAQQLSADGVLGDYSLKKDNYLNELPTVETILNAFGDQDLIKGVPIPIPTPNIRTRVSSLPSIPSLTSSTSSLSSAYATPQSISSIPAINIDWSSETGPVRNQGKCGSCYAIAAVANLEALLAMHTFGFYVQLSAQQVVDCDISGLTFGCDGGFLEGSYLFLKNKGVATEFVYPYMSSLTGIPGLCKTNITGPFKIASYKSIASGNCNAIKTELEKKPVSIGIASYMLQFYSSGTFEDCDSVIDHAVLLVGFHSIKGWKIKNSWGVSWGENGYGWIEDGNNCGICNMATVPRIAAEPN